MDSRVVPLDSAGPLAESLTIDESAVLSEPPEAEAKKGRKTTRFGSALFSPSHKSIYQNMKDGMENIKDELSKGRNQDFVRMGYDAQVYKRHRRSVLIALRELLIYLVFMVVFGFTSSRFLFNADIYNMGAGLAGQLTDSAFHAEHIHVSRTFKDMTTIQDVDWWFLGPLTDFMNGHPNQMPFRHNVFMGPVRISQLRAEAVECNDRAPPFMSQNRTFMCYDGGKSTHLFDTSFEDRLDYGNFSGKRGQTKFLYEGINAHTSLAADIDSVEVQRGTTGTPWATFDARVFPAPAFAVLVEPSRGPSEGKRAIEALVRSDYIDSHTRAVFVDMALYNPMVQHVCWMRFAIEITEAGSLIMRHDFSALHLWDRLHPSGVDSVYWTLEIFVMLFYIYYFFQEVAELFDEGWKYFQDWLNLCQMTNVVFYICFMALWHGADYMLPIDFDVDGARFVDFKPIATLKRSAVVFTACNIFLNW
jgi:hypothetical protein